MAWLNTDNRSLVREIAELIEPKSWIAKGIVGKDSIAHDNRRISSLRKAVKIIAHLAEHEQKAVSPLHSVSRTSPDRPAER